MQDKVYHSNFQVENEYWWFTARAHILRSMMQKYCPMPRGSTVLDIGCGTGGFLQLLAEDGFNAVGMDTSELAIEYCQKRGLKNIYKTTLEDFPAKDWTINAEIMLDVIEHIDDDKGVVKQAYSVLEPGGYFIATVPAYQWLWSAHDEIHLHKRRYTLTSFRKLLTNAGFKPIRFSYFNTFLFPAAAIKRLFDKNKKPEDIHDVVDPVSPAVNSLLDVIFKAETPFLNYFSFPFGVSIVAICQK